MGSKSSRKAPAPGTTRVDMTLSCKKIIRPCLLHYNRSPAGCASRPRSVVWCGFVVVAVGHCVETCHGRPFLAQLPDTPAENCSDSNQNHGSTTITRLPIKQCARCWVRPVTDRVCVIAVRGDCVDVVGVVVVVEAPCHHVMALKRWSPRAWGAPQPR